MGSGYILRGGFGSIMGRIDNILERRVYFVHRYIMRRWGWVTGTDRHPGRIHDLPLAKWKPSSHEIIEM